MSSIFAKALKNFYSSSAASWYSTECQMYVCNLVDGLP